MSKNKYTSNFFAQSKGEFVFLSFFRLLLQMKVLNIFRQWLLSKPLRLLKQDICHSASSGQASVLATSELIIFISKYESIHYKPNQTRTKIKDLVQHQFFQLLLAIFISQYILPHSKANQTGYVLAKHKFLQPLIPLYIYDTMHSTPITNQTRTK